MRLFHIMFPLVRRSSYDILLRKLAETKLDLEVSESERRFYKSVSRGRLNKINDLENKTSNLESKVEERP